METAVVGEGFIPGGKTWKSWYHKSNGEWEWRGDPTIHGVGETQGGSFVPETGEGYNSWYAQFFPRSKTADELKAEESAKTATELSETKQIAGQQTARTLELLRQQLGQGSRYETENLRRNLSQRGLLDSGSLGAGLGRINENYGRQMATGTMAAANQEGGTILGLMAEQRARIEAEKDRQLRKYLAERGYEAQIESARIAASNRPSEPDPWASAFGSFAGAVAPSVLPFLFGTGDYDSYNTNRSRNETRDYGR